VLAPGLRRGQTVVLDNPGAHNSERAKELTKELTKERNKVAGYSLYLPPCWPDFNPFLEDR
jgi:transposase